MRDFFAALLPGLRAAFLSAFCFLRRALSFFCATRRRIFIDRRLSCFPMKSPLFGNSAVLSRSLRDSRNCDLGWVSRSRPHLCPIDAPCIASFDPNQWPALVRRRGQRKVVEIVDAAEKAARVGGIGTVESLDVEVVAELVQQRIEQPAEAGHPAKNGSAHPDANGLRCKSVVTPKLVGRTFRDLFRPRPKHRKLRWVDPVRLGQKREQGLARLLDFRPLLRRKSKSQGRGQLLQRLRRRQDEVRLSIARLILATQFGRARDRIGDQAGLRLRLISLMSELVEASCEVTSPLARSSGKMALASFLPSSTPHWS